MGYVNRIILTGRLTGDPDLRYTANEVPVARFRLASDRPFKNKNGAKEADFINIAAWNGLAKICENYLKKGRMVAVEGRLQIRPYEKNGQKLSFTEVVADNIQMLDSKFYQATEKVEVPA